MTGTSWSVEQETMLFKSICRVKPVGPHKHFRMLTIHSMVNSGEENKTKTIGIKQIWTKLESLYDLKGLDEIDNTELTIDESKEGDQEDVTMENTENATDSEGNEDQFHEFELPLDDWILLVEAKAQDHANEQKEDEAETQKETAEKDEDKSEEIESTEQIQGEQEQTTDKKEETVKNDKKRALSTSEEVASDSETELKPSRKTRSSARFVSTKPNKKEEIKKEVTETKKEKIETKKLKEEVKKPIEDHSDVENTRSTRRGSNRIKQTAPITRKESPAPESTPRRSSRRK